MSELANNFAKQEDIHNTDYFDCLACFDRFFSKNKSCFLRKLYS